MRKILKLAPERMRTHYFRFRSRGAVNARSLLLERLLARADVSNPISDWRADAFGVIAPPMTPMPGLGAAALYAERGLVDAASVFIATPVHYIAEISNVRLPADGILRLHQAEAEVLAADFNRVWSDAGIRLLAGRGADLFCLVDQPTTARTSDPEDVLGRLIENYLPSGAADRRLRQLMSEIEMWLFEHAVNRARAAAAAPTVSGLWLWGGGPALASLPSVQGWTAGNDPFFRAFAARPDPSLGTHADTAPRAATTSGAAETSAAATTSGAAATSGVLVTTAEPGGDEWRDIESQWLERSLAELRSGGIARLDLSAGNRCFTVSARWNRRFWRRRRPWWESFA